MKKYRTILTKSYAITIVANSAQKAKRIAEFYTGDIKDISVPNDRKKFHFLIKNIECVINESLDAEEIKEH